MKFYYLQDPNGYFCQLFATKSSALAWIKDTSKNVEEYDYPYEPLFQEDDLQILYVSTHNKKSMLKAMRNASMIVGTRLFTPEVDHD